MNRLDELRHLEHGAHPGEMPDGAGLVTVHLTSDRGIETVVARSKEVIACILEASDDNSLDIELLHETLPSWFVDACAPERTEEEQRQWLQWWRGLDSKGRAEEEYNAVWSLDNWLYWLEPAERQWFWWDAVAHDPHSARILVEVPGWPYASGALEWLLRAAGATEINISDDIVN